ncbi:hypothetical protein ZeamMp149 (mitochondrion) [Zea mays subsp. mays]|jgi:hypothetical protein|uniref:Uncharacterized protein orf133-b n=1 Tax=Zea mays TaxID=4577 RepID=Q6R9B2_MAIZE|nr:hypothetical protein ZeamMp149 [Zea mays subsp. mays]AAR91100.1 hypothetical protein [Zea mays]WEB51517.1 hypothetical protein [Zea mays]WEB51677.1 hypothetical protein [Zea mays]|eukprot:YP_588396.1 hypothetical protein ZeamMp149 (mitochondrion) [Zea mays subsp. mays]
MTFCNNELVLLMQAIDSVYNDDWRVRGATSFIKDRLKEIIYTTGEYHFYPIDLYHLDKYYLKKENFLYQLVTMEMEMEEDRGVLTTECVNGDDLHVYKCRFASDALLRVSKSVIKHRLSLSRWIWILHTPATH